MSDEWYIMHNQNLSGYEREEFDKAYGVFNQILEESPEAYNVLLNGNPYRLIVQSSPKYGDSQVKRTILFNRGEVTRGDMIFHDDKDWLVFDMPLYNRIYEKSTMVMCTHNMHFTYIVDGVIDHYDDLDNPVYSIPPRKETKIFKCSVLSVRDLEADTGRKINLPEGYTILYIQSTDDKLITIDNKFEIFGEPYRIRGIDKSMLFNGYGVLEIVAEKTTAESE